METHVRAARSRASGWTLPEALVVLAILSLVVSGVAAASVPWLVRERRRSAVYDVQSFLRITRVEAVKRNRPCRFVVRSAGAVLEVWDGNGTPTTADDTLLRRTSLPAPVVFASPDATPPLALAFVASGVHQTVFRSDGTVASGVGSVSFGGGGGFDRISVYGAGGVQILQWDGSAWSGGGG